GEASGCTDETVDVLVEAALFDPVRTAMTGRKHGIDSDARYRFERGVDPQAMIDGINYATQLIIDMCGGEAGELVVAGDVPAGTKDVSFRPSRVKALGGVDLDAKKSIALLERLGFKKGASKDDAITMTVPSWRMDVEGEADLVEDVLRLHGFDKIPSTPLPRIDVVAKSTLTPRQIRARAARRRLAAEGLMESVSWSFMSDTWAKRFGGGLDCLRVDNPISSDLNMMRPSILPNLLFAALKNIDRGAKSVSLFEVGPQYADDTPEGQAHVATGVRVGAVHDRHWASPSKVFDVYDAKACAIAALEAAGAPTGNLMVFNEAADWYHPGRSGTLRLGPKVVLAAFGELHPRILKDMGLKTSAVGFEVYLDAIPAQRKKGASKPALQVSDLQAVERDFAFLVANDVAADAIIKAARGGAKKFVKAIRVFDVFEGQGVPEGQKSIAISMTLEPKDKTFTDAEIEKISADVVSSVAKATGASLRI
ncbi:MAG: phenylalanine--tRNA ligase subunit beta, partial [Sphingomonadales bacterium]|nr:phenylalanine--tRNA ligase subunit beta [Sphingomonadales bacterium]